MFLSLMYLPLACLRHWRGLVVFVLLLPGAARRSTRIADTHHHAGQQTHAFTTALKESAESWGGINSSQPWEEVVSCFGPAQSRSAPTCVQGPPVASCCTAPCNGRSQCR